MSAPPKPRVLIVEDHPVLGAMLAEFVEADGTFGVCGTVQGGQAALDWLDHEGCDVALVDVRMPGMSGIELVRRLGEVRPDFPCVVVTALVEPVYESEALAAGARAYVRKEDPVGILAALRAAVGLPTEAG